MLSALTLLGLSACQKDIPPVPTAATQTQQSITPRVVRFVEQATHHANGRGNSSYTADSAAWYVEAAVNYSAAQGWLPHTETAVDTMVLPFDFSTGTVPEATAWDAYALLLDAIAPLTTDAQHLMFVDVVATSEALGSGQLLVLCQIGSGYERSYNNPPNTYYPPNYSCSWDNSQQQGMPCDQLSADLVIANRINTANMIALQLGQYVHSVETWTVSHIPTSISAKNFQWKDSFIASSTPNNNGVHETLFFSAKMNDPATYPCLDATEMAYWTGNATTNGTWRGITKIRQAYCPTKIFFGCKLNGAVVSPPGESPDIIYGIHAAQMKFGLIATENPGS